MKGVERRERERESGCVCVVWCGVVWCRVRQSVEWNHLYSSLNRIHDGGSSMEHTWNICTKGSRIISTLSKCRPSIAQNQWSAEEKTQARRACFRTLPLHRLSARLFAYLGTKTASSHLQRSHQLAEIGGTQSSNRIPA